MNARVKQQGGWAGSFVIVGIVLALLLVGGVYVLKTNQMNSEIASDTGLPSAETDANQNEDQKQSEQKEQSEDQAKKDDSSQAAEQSTDDSTAASETDAADLPQTGPADTLASLVVMTILAYSISAYIASRRRLTF